MAGPVLSIIYKLSPCSEENRCSKRISITARVDTDSKAYDYKCGHPLLSNNF